MTITEALMRAKNYGYDVILGISGKKFDGRVLFVNSVAETIEFQPADRIPGKLIVRIASVDYVEKA